MRVYCEECSRFAGEFFEDLNPQQIRRHCNMFVLGKKNNGFLCVCFKCFYNHSKPTKIEIIPSTPKEIKTEDNNNSYFDLFKIPAPILYREI